jgi:hypothetical protein
MSESEDPRRLASTLLLLGAILLLVGNVTHPVDSEPTATSRLDLAVTAGWMPIHLTIAAGVLAVVGGLVILARTFQHPRAAAYGQLGGVGALVGGTALFLVFGALDGYGQAALGEMQRAGDVDAVGIDAAALALESIDSGMTAMGILGLFGVALLAFGAALRRERVVQPWLGWMAIVLGVLGTVTGTFFAVLGATTLVINGLFRPLAMASTVYFVVLAVVLRRTEPAPTAAAV